MAEGRIKELIRLLLCTMQEFREQNCIGCQDELGNQLDHSCLVAEKWEYYYDAIKYLYEGYEISELEYDILRNIS